MAVTETKQCSRCKEVRPRSDFHKNARKRDGLMPHCKTCERLAKQDRAARMALRPGTPEYYTKMCPTCGDVKPLGAFHKYRASPDGRQARCKACQAEDKTQPEARRKAREAWYARQYGITPDDYARMGRAQRWRCAVCERPPYPKGSRLVVDHDHACGTVRGLLCSPCNSALGLMGDKPDRLDAAARYLSERADLRSQVS